MTPEEIAAEAAQKTADDLVKKEAFDKQQKELKEKNVDDLVSIINDTRTEARDRRLKERELEAELEKMKTETKEKTNAKLLEDGKLQELVSSQKSELSTMTALADEMKQFKTAKIVQYKTKHGDKWLGEYGDLSLTAMDALDNSLTSTNGGKGKTDTGVTTDTTKIELTVEQKNDAIAKYPHSKKEDAYLWHYENLVKRKIIKTEK